MGGALVALASGAICLVLYLIRVNWVMTHTPKDVAELADEPLTTRDIRKISERVKKEGANWEGNWEPRLPLRRDRRYVVVGGSGVVGGHIILHLLARGTPPEAIRILDTRCPVKEELSGVAFIQTDVTDETATIDAYSAAWPESVARLPLTVFHAAAVIRPFERLDMFYDRCSRVNVGGTAHSLAAARKVGAGIFIFTSSSHAGLGEARWFFAPWGRRQQPLGYVQYLSTRDFFKPATSESSSPTTYARSKAEAERLVCGADDREGGMRTGAIRPGNAVYGDRNDVMLGALLKLGMVLTWVAQNVQNFVNVRNVSLAHLQYEAALLGEHADKVAGRPYVVTDDGPPVRFEDAYSIMRTLVSTGFKTYYAPPVLVILFSFAVEAYIVLLARVPFLQRFLSEPGDPLWFFQPALTVAGWNMILDDSDAKRAPEDGGFGYTPCCRTVDGICRQVDEWNEWTKREKK